MKAYGEVGAQFHIFLTSLGGSEWSMPNPADVTLAKIKKYPPKNG
jgi:hypothetical protein